MNKYLDWTTGKSNLDVAIENYLAFGIRPGGFLTAVLCNDLFRAVGCADHFNRRDFSEIVTQLMYYLPMDCYGSPEVMEDWIKDVNGRRSKWADRARKQFLIRSLKGDHRDEYQYPQF